MDKTLRDNTIASKEPWLAVVLSTFSAGIGQIYSGRTRRGVILICIQANLFFCMLWFVFSLTGDIRIGVALFLPLISISIWNFFDAYKCAKAENTEDFEISRKQNKDPWLAVFLSDLIPGLGQIYIRKWLWGIVFIIIFIALPSLKKSNAVFFFGLWAVFQAFVCYHTYVFSPTHRETSRKLIVIVTMITLGWELFDYTYFPIKEYFVEAYRMPKRPELFDEGPRSYSPMSPTLAANDRFLVRKTVTYTSKRGDIIVFKSPEDPEIPYVMRLIAFEGESVEIKNKTVYLNAKKIQSPIIQNIKYVSMGKFGFAGGPYIVPKGSVFVLGDNSNNSRDSRFYGAIPKSEIVGRAYKIYWPPKRIGLLY
jgi:signal peptidase I